jgi:hypothetical protein
VDLTLSSEQYYVKQTHAFDNVLQLTLEACNKDEFCAESMGGGDGLAAYDKLAKLLKQSPQLFDFPLTWKLARQAICIQRQPE